MFVPTDPACLIPTKYLDIMRTTYDDPKAEKRIEDYWNVQDARPLSDSWLGKPFLDLAYPS